MNNFIFVDTFIFEKAKFELLNNNTALSVQSSFK